MGNFYANVLVKGTSPERVREALRASRVHALITPALKESVVVYEEESDGGDLERLTEIAAHLSKRTAAIAMAAMNHDDDVLILALFDRGKAVSTYANPGAGSYGLIIPRESWLPFGTAWRMCHSFGRRVHAPYAWLVLQRPYLFQVGRHRALAEVLDLPVPAVLLGFNYVSRGELEGLVPRAAMLES